MGRFRPISRLIKYLGNKCNCTPLDLKGGRPDAWQMKSSDQAQTFALSALAALIEHEDLRDQFLGSSGLAPNELSERANDPEFLGFVLDFILQGDDAILNLSAALSVSPETFVEARVALPGGDTPHWT